MEQNKVKFKDFPEKLKQRVLEIREKQYQKSWIKHTQRNLNNHSLINCFSFRDTEEGTDYWYNIYLHNDFSDFEDSKIIKKDRELKVSRTNAILKVEDKNGSIYKIGDNIRIFEKSCKTYNETFKILDFRWNADKSHICAVTSKHSNGIRLDWIEHYIEKPEFVLPEKWYIKITDENKSIVRNYFISKDRRNIYKKYSIGAFYGYIYTASKLLCARKTPPQIGTEITFEQFKQYVLFDGYKIGDKINTLSAKNAIITDLQYINGQSVAFFKLNNGVSGNWCRVLIKNIIK